MFSEALSHSSRSGVSEVRVVCVITIDWKVPAVVDSVLISASCAKWRYLDEEEAGSADMATEGKDNTGKVCARGKKWAVTDVRDFW